MPFFSYTAVSAAGRRVSGRVESDDAQKARRALRADGVYVVRISEEKARGASSVRGRVSDDEMVVAIRELATLINSAIPLDECLSGTMSQMKDGRLKEMFANIQTRIREGGSFSAALSEYPACFPEMTVSMVRAGEESGTLDLILVRIADFMERRLTFRNRLLGIMTYPVLMAAVAFLVLIFILTFVAPTFTRIFDEMSVRLPAPTLVLIGISRFLKFFWPALLLGAAAAAAGLRRWLATPRGRTGLDGLRLRVPYLRDIFVKTEIAAFARTLATLLTGGVEILESLAISQKVVFSPRLQAEIAEIRDLLARGGSLSSGFQKARLFPYLVTQLVGAGERSGNLPEMFDKIASIYEEEVTQRSSRLVTFLEPCMILFMGAVVGFIVLAVLLPIFGISQSIR